MKGMSYREAVTTQQPVSDDKCVNSVLRNCCEEDSRVHTYGDVIRVYHSWYRFCHACAQAGVRPELVRHGVRIRHWMEALPTDIIILGCCGGGKKARSRKQAGEVSGALGSAAGAALATAVGQPELAPILGAMTGAAAGKATRQMLKPKTQRKMKKAGKSIIKGSGDYVVSRGALGNDVEMNSLIKGAEAGCSFGDFVTKTGNGVRVRHSDFIGDVLASGDDWSIQRFDIDPTDPVTFPFMNVTGKNYAKYRIHGLVFEFISNVTDYSSSTSLGAVGMTFSSDPETPDFSNITAFENSNGATMAKPSEPQFYGVECAAANRPVNVLYTRNPYAPGQGQIIDGAEISDTNAATKWTSFGVLQVGQNTSGYTEGVVLGRLKVHADIEWLEPRQSPETYGFAINKSIALNDYEAASGALVEVTDAEFEGIVESNQCYGQLHDAEFQWVKGDSLTTSPNYCEIKMPSVREGDVVHVSCVSQKTSFDESIRSVWANGASVLLDGNGKGYVVSGSNVYDGGFSSLGLTDYTPIHSVGQVGVPNSYDMVDAGYNAGTNQYAYSYNTITMYAVMGKRETGVDPTLRLYFPEILRCSVTPNDDDIQVSRSIILNIIGNSIAAPITSGLALAKSAPKSATRKVHPPTAQYPRDPTPNRCFVEVPRYETTNV